MRAEESLAPLQSDSVLAQCCKAFVAVTSPAYSSLRDRFLDYLCIPTPMMLKTLPR